VVVNCPSVTELTDGNNVAVDRQPTAPPRSIVMDDPQPSSSPSFTLIDVPPSYEEAT